jgi:transcriptional regulator with XRE-family HTH domain
MCKNNARFPGHFPEPADMRAERAWLGKRLKEARLFAGLSQNMAAKVLGVPRSTISLIESGKRSLDVLEFKKLAALYQRSWSYFVREEQVFDSSVLPRDVEQLARIAATFTPQDLNDLVLFAQFLSSRAEQKR